MTGYSTLGPADYPHGADAAKEFAVAERRIHDRNLRFGVLGDVRAEAAANAARDAAAARTRVRELEDALATARRDLAAVEANAAGSEA